MSAGNIVAATFSKAFDLHRQGRFAEAQLLYQQVLTLQPKHADALHLSGLIALQAGDPRRASTLIEQAIAINARAANYHTSRGLALQALGSHAEALASYDKAIALNPGGAEAHYHRGNALADLSRLSEALSSYDKAISLRPDLAEAYTNRGSVLNDLACWEEAVESFTKAVALNPNLVQALSNRSNSYRMMKRFDEALASADQAIARRPDFVEAHFNRGSALHEMQRFPEAVDAYNRAIALRPNYAKAYANRGHTLQQLSRIEEALANFDSAIALQPTLADTYSLKALALKNHHEFDAALASYDRAIALKADFWDAHWNKAIIYLLMGDFRKGWELYEYRWKSSSLALPNRTFPQPLWLGREPIAGKTILLHSEQGLGDTIQFCRYAGLVAALGAKVLLEVPESLRNLMTDLAGVSELFASGDALPAFDFHCPLLSLPLAFGTELATIPAPMRYLHGRPEALAKWSGILGEKHKPRIGLVWSGSAAHTNDRNRSIPLTTLLEYLPDGFEYVSLQKDVRDSDRIALETTPQVRHFGPQLADFSDTAALCDLMDIVISVDTSVAHLSAAAGRTTWILLPYTPDFRWLLERRDSPWYPSAMLYRQDAACDWTSVVTNVTTDLSALQTSRQLGDSN